MLSPQKTCNVSEYRPLCSCNVPGGALASRACSHLYICRWKYLREAESWFLQRAHVLSHWSQADRRRHLQSFPSAKRPSPPQLSNALGAVDPCATTNDRPAFPSSAAACRGARGAPEQRRGAKILSVAQALPAARAQAAPLRDHPACVSTVPGARHGGLSTHQDGVPTHTHSPRRAAPCLCSGGGDTGWGPLSYPTGRQQSLD